MRNHLAKGGIFIGKESINSKEGNNSKENINCEENIVSEKNTNSDQGPREIYDRIFKRIFSLSDQAIISLINNLFGKDFPSHSSVWYPNTEFILQNLQKRLADIIVIIGGVHMYHLEAQMTKDKKIVLRVFEYGFLYAMSAQDEPDCLNFPEPAVIYLNGRGGMPEKSVLHISFGEQGSFDYHVKNYEYLAHDVEKLNSQKMVILIPFQVLRLHSLLKQWKKCKEEKRYFDAKRFYRLRDGIKDDILNSIKINLELHNITADDAWQLSDLTNQLYDHICGDFEPLGGDEQVKPLLPGALELPYDEYRFRIIELEEENARYADEITRYADENARYADENAKYADENARYADEIVRLKQQIAELKSHPM